MKKVKILCGGYGYTPPGTRRVKTVYAGGTVTVSDEEAMRLVALDAAEVIEDYPAAPVATPSNGEDGSGAGDNIPGGDGGSNKPEKATLDPAQLDKLTVKQLTELAEKMGVDVSKCKLKADYIAAITSAEATPGPGTNPDEGDQHGGDDGSGQTSNGGGSDEDTGGNADGGEDEGGDDQDDDDTVQGGTPPDLSVEGPVE